MTRRFLAIVLSVFLALGAPWGAWAQSGGNCSVYRSWITGD